MKGKSLPASLKRENLSLFSKNLPQTNFLTNKTMCVRVYVCVCFQRVVLQKEHALRFTRRIGNMKRTEGPS